MYIMHSGQQRQEGGSDNYQLITYLAYFNYITIVSILVLWCWLVSYIFVFYRYNGFKVSLVT